MCVYHWIWCLVLLLSGLTFSLKRSAWTLLCKHGGVVPEEPPNPSALWGTSTFLFLLRKVLRRRHFPVPSLAVACPQIGQAHHAGLATVRITETPVGIYRAITHRVPLPRPPAPTLPALWFSADTSLTFCLTSSHSLSFPWALVFLLSVIILPSEWKRNVSHDT